MRNILSFEHDFPDAKTVTLEQNYRSTQPILDIAHSVIKNNTERAQKKLWTQQSIGEPVRLISVYDETRRKCSRSVQRSRISPLPDEPTHVPDIYLGPAALGLARGESLDPGVRVERQLLRIYPAETECLLQRLGMCNRCDAGGLLVNPQQQPVGSDVLLREPRA